MKFWHFYRIVFRRKWIVLGIMAVTLGTVYLSTINDKPYYQAVVQIMPSDSALYRPILPSPGSSIEAAFSGRQTDSQLPNLMSLLKSRSVAERTLKVTGSNEEVEHLLSRIEVGTATNPGARSRHEMGTDIIEIRVSDSEPGSAVITANAVAHVFAGFYQETSHKEAIDNLQFLDSELRQAKLALKKAEDELKAFKRKHRITSVSDVSDSASAALRDAVENRDAARALLAESQARLNRVENQLRNTGPTRKIVEGSSDSPMVQQLESQLADITRQLNDARAKYEDTHPRVIALKESLNEVSGRLRQEKGKIRESVSVVRNPVYESLLQERARLVVERDGLAAKVSQLEANVNRLSGSMLPGTDVDLIGLESSLQRAQTNYTEIERKVGQARINVQETTSSGAVRVIDEAQDAIGPLGTNRKLYLVLGLMLSIVLGIGLTITLDALDNRIKTKADVEQLMGLPVTALIPSASSSSYAALARIVHTTPLSPVAEAYRFLRTDFLLSTQAAGAKTVMVVTAKPGQGGTNTIANLGISLAMDGKRVALVDADMRRPSLHHIFKVSNDVGLSDVLSNEKDWHEVTLGTEVENLMLVPGGQPPSNPSELLGSWRMRTLVQQLADNADYVLIDTPSAVAFTDAVVLSRVVDGVLLVVRAKQVPRGAELQVRNLLNKADANILGVVLNDVQPETVDSFYYHSHYYPDVGRGARRLLQGVTEQQSLPPPEELR